MKKRVMIAAMLTSVLALAQQPSAAKISLADARGQIDKVVSSPEAMKETMKQLSAEDQKAFLAEVNKAVGEMPGSVEEKSALFLSLNTAALASAEKGNSADLFAEVFATVPPESLTVISERFAVDLLSRTADPNVQISDAQYEKIALGVMEKVNERCESTDNGSTRAVFAILTLARASGGTSETLVDHMVDTLKHDDAKEMARNEWIPSALGTNGREQSYEAILASADAGRRPDPNAVLVIAGPLFSTAVLADLNGKFSEADMFSQTQTPLLDAAENLFGHQVPVAGNDKPGGAGASGGAVNGAAVEAGVIGGGGEGSDARPNPQNPDPQNTGHSPVPYRHQVF